MNIEQLVEREFTGETKVLGENLPYCHYVNHKSLTTYLELNPSRCSEKPEITSRATEI
jgi:hypothetical protein